MKRKTRNSIAVIIIALFGFGCIIPMGHGMEFFAFAQEQSRESSIEKQGTWVKSGSRWWFKLNGGGYATGKTLINGNLYFFDSNGWMQTGWQAIGGKWYYFGSSGAALKGWVKIGTTYYYMNSSGVMQTGWLKSGGRWYYLKSSGAMATGWNKIGPTWYYLNGSGAMQTGWLKQGRTWYYFNGSGAMATGWAKVGRTYYYFSGSGAMQTGWLKQGGTWYYLNGSGAMATGWTKVGSSYYYFASSGAMQTGWLQEGNVKYYLSVSGAMATGWTKIGNDWYYFDGSGCMLHDTWVGDYYLNSNGVWDVNHAGCNHVWGPHVKGKSKWGTICNSCKKDISDYADPYDCHGAWSSHEWYLNPCYYECQKCGVKKHEHDWVFTYYRNPDKPESLKNNGFWTCRGCGNQTWDAEKIEPLAVSKEGYKTGSIDIWETPYEFDADPAGTWILKTASTEPADPFDKVQEMWIDGINSLAPGEGGKMELRFDPPGAMETVTWASSNPEIVSIDQNGNYKALSVGTATITAKSETGHIKTHFIRVTEENIGCVKTSKLLVNGESNPNGPIVLTGHGKDYEITLQTDPGQAVYEVRYSIENQVFDDAIYDKYRQSIWISGSSLKGNRSLYSWEHNLTYTDPTSKVTIGRPGKATIKAEIVDMNGNKTVIRQDVVMRYN